MKLNINLAKLMPSNQIRGEDEGETEELKAMHKEACSYICSFKWCLDVKASYLGFGIGRVVGIFLVNITPSKASLPNWVWIVIGDLPPAYISIRCNSTPYHAIRGYIREMRKWVDAVEDGTSIDDLIPVNIAPIAENADRLDSRLNRLETEILPIIKRERQL